MAAQTATRDHHQVLRKADETQRKPAVAADAGAFELSLVYLPPEPPATHQWHR